MSTQLLILLSVLLIGIVLYQCFVLYEAFDTQTNTNTNSEIATDEELKEFMKRMKRYVSENATNSNENVRTVIREIREMLVMLKIYLNTPESERQDKPKIADLYRMYDTIKLPYTKRSQTANSGLPGVAATASTASTATSATTPPVNKLLQQSTYTYTPPSPTSTMSKDSYEKKRQELEKEKEELDRLDKLQPSVILNGDNQDSKLTENDAAAMNLKSKSDLIRDIREVIRNELSRFKSMTTASSQDVLKEQAKKNISRKMDSDNDISVSRQMAEQQGREMSAYSPKRECPANMDEYIRKDSIPCWGCTLDY